ncbi:MAG: SGNH/GDSL hydrolase family protein [Spirochaetia bacterium]|jgi:lysophospholipase L1-like esterase|nr:SGNH/GDSL hydrolase family protein [Spirochaetales bacterium]MDX9784007.1 SGNH/GDSL hydrolase family protein [Spirochaetia bacterium]
MVPGNIYLFGDSVARGIILSDEGKYIPIRESFAFLAAEKLGISVINKARFGCTITKGLSILHRFISGQDAPETALGNERGVAILEFGGNDCDFLWNEIAARPEAVHTPLTPLNTFYKVYCQMIDALRAKGFKASVMSLPPLVAERYLAWITRNGLDREAILHWLGGVDKIFTWHEGYDKIVRKIAAEKDCELLDIRKDFLVQKDYKAYICNDGIHPNGAGHRLMETSLLRYASLS